jgi:hypothetical protein
VEEAPDRTDPVRQVLGFRPGAFGPSLDGADAEMRSRGDRTAPSTWGRRHESLLLPYTLLRRFDRRFCVGYGGVQEVSSSARTRDATPQGEDEPPTDVSFRDAGVCHVAPYPCPPGLRDGESMTATLSTSRRWKGTGIVLEGGAGYVISAFDARWTGSVPEVPEGCERTDRGFALVGSVGADMYVVDCRWQDQGRIGWGLVCRARQIGTDRGDEHGRIEIRVTRRPR